MHNRYIWYEPKLAGTVYRRQYVNYCLLWLNLNHSNSPVFYVSSADIIKGSFHICVCSVISPVRSFFTSQLDLQINWKSNCSHPSRTRNLSNHYRGELCKHPGYGLMFDPGWESSGCVLFYRYWTSWEDTSGEWVKSWDIFKKLRVATSIVWCPLLDCNENTSRRCVVSTKFHSGKAFTAVHFASNVFSLLNRAMNH